MQRPALFHVRLIAFAGLVVCLILLLANLAQSYDSFNPSYIGYFLKQQVLRPAVGIVAWGLMLTLARPISRWLDRA